MAACEDDALAALLSSLPVMRVNAIFCGLVVAILTLTGCSNPETGDVAASPGDAVEIVPVGRSDDREAVRFEAQSRDGATVYSSAYTSFSKNDCVRVSGSAEASDGEFRCLGYKGVPLFLQDSDLRSDLDAGVANARFETTGPYNRIMDTIEWRMRDGKPFAIIFRYDVHHEIGPKPTTLAIEKIGSTGAPGCRVAHIAGSSPNPNLRAREAADDTASDFVCGADKPQTVGDATLTVREG